DQLPQEQTIELRHRQRLPVDARLESTGPHWDLTDTNGESEPQPLLAQSALPAGARLLSEKATLRAEGLVTESRVARLVSEWRGSRDTAEAEVDFHLSRATKQESLRTLADRVGEVFTLVVIAIAAVLLFIPFETGPAGWLRALALLVVTCPCIFGFAIPLAETMAVNKAARSGLVVRDPSFFQRLQRVKKTFLDKTGTLTTGRMVYLGFKIVDYHQTNRQSQSIDHHVSELLSLAYAIEQNDPHPIARAICDTAQARGLSPSPLIMSSQRLPEGGRTAIGKGGAYLIRTRAQTSDSGRIEVELSLNGDVLGLFFFKDEIRPYALALVQFLSARGHDLSILSGDHPLPLQRIAQRIAPDSAQASIQTYANMTARQKAETIRQQGEASAVMMIGDGVNDADALKAADVSIAVRGDFATCLESADAVLVSHDLQPIVEALLISDRLKKALRLSLTFSATFNVIAATLAITGHMSPMIAAILMPLSSLSVSGISWTILRQEPRKRPVAAAKVEGAKA
ncbi:MAG: HAD-IC family P-type ATPase, partial [Bdellovibrionales bacterium]|nr:HAD-IC family P-type ATPase [Bdellovibrionales bacterium]